MTAASAALVIVMALLLFWSQHRLTTATKANDLADEIVSNVFDRNTLRSDYLRNNNQRAKDQWFSKQDQIRDLLKKVPALFVSIDDREIIDDMHINVEGSSAVFEQITENRDLAGNGQRHQLQANEIENRLTGQLVLKSYDTIAAARRLQEASSQLIAATQRTAAWVSISIIASLAFFMIIVVWSLGRIISKGIENLRLGAAAIGAGNLQHMIPLTGEDEFAEVAGAFNTMSVNVAESHAALEQEIDERKSAADRIVQLNKELNNTVSQLQGANQELEAFSYSVSHDLRAPLRAMGGFSEALVEDYGGQLEGDAHAYLDEIVIGCRHMGQLIDGLLTLSRSTRGELRCDTLNLSVMADRIRRELEQTEPGRRVEWRIEPGMSALGDERMIEVVMRNLLGNAWKYTSGRAEPVIRFYAELDNGVRFFCVADNGAGFNMAHAGKLFQAFQRLHRQEEFTGIGIGLATAQRIVQRHGGTIHGYGETDKGATFKYSLPLGEESEKREES
jgi:signal transduction histidine kinase